MFDITDIEYLLIFFILVIMFIKTLKARPVAIKGVGIISYFSVSKEMTTLLKAFACVMILIGHYADRDLSSGIATKVDKLIFMTSANIALVLFMFFSGYGLTVKDYKKVRLLNEWGGAIFKNIFSIAIYWNYLCDNLLFSTRYFLDGYCFEPRTSFIGA